MEASFENFEIDISKFKKIREKNLYVKVMLNSTGVQNLNLKLTIF
jgi:hypothetical protein